MKDTPCLPVVLPEEFWVFAYGSLMWNPGFPFLEVQAGRIDGYQRSLSVLSTIYRGTPERPGLVMGLDKGGYCSGLTFRVAPENVQATIAYLDEREQVTRVYCPHLFDTLLNDGRWVQAYTFVVRREHEQYAGKMSLEHQALLVAQGVGLKGRAIDYLANTLAHIQELGFSDRQLVKVLELARAHVAQEQAPA
ncbi:gamma-glutamylcyclotransferase [Magnetovibrio blakemorei]|uniref:glutathione-specific gamma-glutamylcyclotransferase n=1 Tax=Magnetovibrio blakemorei TaxID=28181 RepID=A0A1E5QC48_9PROT|nr:gamma-glutamylcyclotransferase [Magnetovibrio blakemorei]OEJ69627.1 hypothetical protein BEN30_01965 [Magnetovibrio blakemorei]